MSLALDPPLGRKQSASSLAFTRSLGAAERLPSAEPAAEHRTWCKRRYTAFGRALPTRVRRAIYMNGVHILDRARDYQYPYPGGQGSTSVVTGPAIR